MKTAAVVTGATGYLGSHLGLQLLRLGADTPIICLARGGQDGARARVVRALEQAGRDAGAPGEALEHEDRLIVLEDDLLGSRDDAAALDDIAGLAIGAFWHCAAAVKFVETPAREVWHTNLTGLQGALARAVRVRAAVFNHVSTAYACGTTAGRVPEQVFDPPAACNNVYEESKQEGERLVQAFCAQHGMPYRIIRPSIIIGHSQTFRTSTDSGFYTGIAALKALHDRTVAEDRFYFERHPLRVCVDRNATLDLVPVDVVVDEMLELQRIGGATLNQVVHVTSESPISMCDWLHKFAASIGIRRVEIMADESALSPLDRLFMKQLLAFLPYATRRRVFDRRNAARHGIDARQLAYLLDTERLACFARAYLAERQGATSAAAAG